MVSERRLVDGKWRRYYSITPAGQEVLREIRTKLTELASEVLTTKQIFDEQ